MGKYAHGKESSRAGAPSCDLHAGKGQTPDHRSVPDVTQGKLFTRLLLGPVAALVPRGRSGSWRARWRRGNVPRNAPTSRDATPDTVTASRRPRSGGWAQPNGGDVGMLVCQRSFWRRSTPCSVVRITRSVPPSRRFPLVPENVLSTITVSPNACTALAFQMTCVQPVEASDHGRRAAGPEPAPLDRADATLRGGHHCAPLLCAVATGRLRLRVADNHPDRAARHALTSARRCSA